MSSRSSVKTLTYGSLMRAVTFQSMVRISSPGWYWRTSEKAMPRPLKTEWYWPASMSVHHLAGGDLQRRILLDEVLREHGRHYGTSILLEDPLNDLLGGQVLRLGLVGERDAVAEDVEADRLHVLGGDEAAVAQEGVRARPPGSGRWWRAGWRRTRW